MTAGKIAAIVISNLVGVGIFGGVLGASGYNKYQYNKFTPYISSKDKNICKCLYKDMEKLYCLEFKATEKELTPQDTKKFVKKFFVK